MLLLFGLLVLDGCDGGTGEAKTWMARYCDDVREERCVDLLVRDRGVWLFDTAEFSFVYF